MRDIIILLLLLLMPAGASADMDRGKMLYDAWCAQCHGYEGEGNGYASGTYTRPQPRDFTLGTYKFRTTPSGDPPTDDDIALSTRRGNPGTSMPPWTRFTDEQVLSIVEYIKSFEEETFEYEAEPFEVGTAPAPSDALIRQGMDIFEKAKCWECHGQAGRGDGEKGWQPDFRNDWGTRAYPTDLTHAWEYRNFPAVEDIYRSVTSGFDGTPMASFQTSYSDGERWALAHYVRTLQVERKTGSALTAVKTGAVPDASDTKQWEAADYIDLPLSGQIIFEPRQFAPSATNMRVRSMYTDEEIALALEWTDKKPNRGDDGLPPDAVRVQFPQRVSAGAEKPYLFSGDSDHPVNLWYWSFADGSAEEQNSRGHTAESLTMQEQSDTEATSSYHNGLYRVVFRRALSSGDERDVLFSAGTFIPFSVAVYDGEDGDEGTRAAISGWYYIMLQPPTPMQVYVMPPLAALSLIAIGMFARKRLKDAAAGKEHSHV